MNNFLWILLSIFIISLSWFTRNPLFAWTGCFFLLLLFAAWVQVSITAHPSAKRTISATHVQQGDSVQVHIRLHAPNRLWGWMMAQEASSPLPLQGEREVIVSAVGQKELSFRYTLSANRRGYFPIGPLSLRYGDNFGFAEGRVALLDAEPITVFPKLIPLGKLRFSIARSPGELRTSRRTFEDSTRPAGIRSYVAGDALRRVHWRATAHTGTPQSKIYDVCTSLQAFFLLNFNKSDLPSNPLEADQTTELAVSLTASLATHLLSMGQRVGLLSNGLDLKARDEYLKDSGVALLPESISRLSEQLALRSRIFLRPSRSSERPLELLSLLARLQPVSGNPVSALLDEAKLELSWGETIVVVTPSISKDALSSLTALSHAGFSLLSLIVGDSRSSTRSYLRLSAAGIPCVHIRNEEEIGVLFS